MISVIQLSIRIGYSIFGRPQLKGWVYFEENRRSVKADQEPKYLIVDFIS
jgi:hypothetical protein